MAKNLVSRPILSPLGQIRGAIFFFSSKILLRQSLIRYHGQLSSRTITETINDPILRILNDGQTKGQMNRRTRVIS